jgi:DNA topoisomerase I
MNVVIVESPAKAKTINKYLGDSYTVLASYGHIRDLPSKNGSVDPDNDFAMTWEADPQSKKRLTEIARAVKGSDTLYLATDPDREGEAISWHLLEVLKQKKALKDVSVKRVAFHEITKSAILKAMAEPRQINDELVYAYLARRALDYLVGFTLSPVLWRKLPGARSAGRVQSVALRIVCDREGEIEIFEPIEYWSVLSDITSESGATFNARLYSLNGKRIDKHDLNNGDSAEAAAVAIRNSIFRVAKVEKKPSRRNPQPPFTTSTLQQEAARKLKFSARHTMRVAQSLYEGKTIGGETQGLISYMRTDSVSIAGEAVAACRSLIASRYGDNFVPEAPRTYKSKAKNAQEAHEAIRPTVMHLHPKEVASSLDEDERRLYDLIWKRTVASQMASAVLEGTRVTMANDDASVELRTSGSVVQFEGFLKIYQEGQDERDDEDNEKRLPALKEGENLEITDVVAHQHFTDPPPRFTEASLVKMLEELGIGRPSTYASTLSVLRDRNYVHMDRGRFVPEDKGRIVTAFLEIFFARYVEYDFTADLEQQLDQISAGEVEWKATIREFWQDFHPKTEEVLGIRNSIILDELNEFLKTRIFPVQQEGVDPRACPVCDDGQLSLKVGKFGAFVGCSHYPECNFTRKLTQSNEEATANGNDGGPMVLGHHPDNHMEITLRDGRFGPYVQLGEAEKGSKPPRSSIPKDIDVQNVDMDMAIALLSLPREVGMHPETGKPIVASIGRFGPYVLHDRIYGKLSSTQEVFDLGLNRAVTLLAESKAKGPKKSAALRELGEHPEDGEPIRVMDGRYGPYVKHLKTNATLPNGMSPDEVTLEKAVELIAARVAKGGKKKKKKAPRKKSA